jgi:DNA-binding CsgD family transcriptional regulator
MDAPDTHEDLLELLSQSGKAVFAIDASDRIVLWNTGAERLLGFPAAEVLGRNCYGALAGRDIFGNRYCFADCPILKMRDRGETIQPFEIVLETRMEGPKRVRCSILSIPGQRPELTTLVHILSESVQAHPDPGGFFARFAGPIPHPALATITPPRPAPAPLTKREREVLRLLSEGKKTDEMGEQLFISDVTVRNHIQNILRKLGVHSKLEAVVYAYQNQLI